MVKNEKIWYLIAFVVWVTLAYFALASHPNIYQDPNAPERDQFENCSNRGC